MLERYHRYQLPNGELTLRLLNSCVQVHAVHYTRKNEFWFSVERTGNYTEKISDWNETVMETDLPEFNHFQTYKMHRLTSLFSLMKPILDSNEKEVRKEWSLNLCYLKTIKQVLELQMDTDLKTIIHVDELNEMFRNHWSFEIEKTKLISLGSDCAEEIGIEWMFHLMLNAMLKCLY